MAATPEALNATANIVTIFLFMLSITRVIYKLVTWLRARTLWPILRTDNRQQIMETHASVNQISRDIDVLKQRMPERGEANVETLVRDAINNSTENGIYAFLELVARRHDGPQPFSTPGAPDRTVFSVPSHVKHKGLTHYGVEELGRDITLQTLQLDVLKMVVAERLVELLRPMQQALGQNEERQNVAGPSYPPQAGGQFPLTSGCTRGLEGTRARSKWCSRRTLRPSHRRLREHRHVGGCHC
ncbi:hypothetical protein JB92DRAFT_65706 [Gautieria morchelliformis]|nr:hypothetical protein JB92DRAFT_65706 [Gautieria morchelliformis]